MNKSLLYSLSLLILACNGDKDYALKPQDTTRAAITHKTPTDPSQYKAWNDSVKKVKLAFWKKQATLMSVSLDADRAMMNKAEQFHLARMPGKKKRELEEANTTLLKDKIRYYQIKDSIKKYQE